MVDFAAIKSKHSLWGLKLSTYLGGTQLEADKDIMSHHECALGQWLYSTGLHQYGHLPEMKALEKNHRELHEAGLRIVELKQQSRIAEAQQELAKIAPLTQAIMKHLDTLDKQVATEHKQ
jgi:hypothetical protein